MVFQLALRVPYSEVNQLINDVEEFGKPKLKSSNVLVKQAMNHCPSNKGLWQLHGTSHFAVAEHHYGASGSILLHYAECVWTLDFDQSSGKCLEPLTTNENVIVVVLHGTFHSLRARARGQQAFEGNFCGDS